VRGSWNAAFFDELEAFDPETKGLHDDQVDALSGAFAELAAPVTLSVATHQSGKRRAPQ